MDKKNDLVLNMLANPTFSLNNFKTVGLTADNTTLLDEDKYLNSSKIQNAGIFKDESGNFSKSKFHDFYNTAKSAYNFMATDLYNDDFAKKARSYHRDNIFAPKDLKRTGPDFQWTKMSNPDRFTSSIVQLGKTQQSDKTWDELAQTQKVLANPIEATREDGTIDESKAIWHDSPNDSWFTDFFSTRVAAQWDEDGDHLDPVTGEKTHHKKGDLKLNNEGNYYYENLEGRDVYGRRVLNKMNTLTTDGSEWNKYDFFDSDGYDKSVGGTILKNTALVGSMFIPYVGWGVAGLSVATQTAGLLGTLGKMFIDSDNKTFSNMEGWAKSVNRQEAKSQYAQEHTWALENLIGMVGDVMGQFKEQRWLFEKAPIIFKNKYGFVNAGNYKDKVSELEQVYSKLNQTKMEDLIKTGLHDINQLQKGFKELSVIPQLRAEADMDSYIKGYNKIGEILSKAYMTGITVGDTYGEAKLQNATDNEAMMLTLGYAAGEAAILNTGIGEWLFPELRYEKLHQKAVAEALLKAKGVSKEVEEKMASSAIKEGEKEIKKNYFKDLFNIGKKTAQDLYKGYQSTGDKTIKAAFFNAMGEGSEEVAEEFLADFSKACFNGVEWLRGKKTRLDAFDNGNWQDLLSRYSMNFVGGFIGGGAAGLSLDSIRNMKKLNNMEFDPAIQELMYMVRNGKAKDFLRLVDKMELGDKNKSATKFSTDADGQLIADAGTINDNQDLAAKKMIKAQVKLFEDIIQGEGMQISDDSFLAQLTDLLPDLKFALLRNSSTAGRFLQEFNSLGVKMFLANALLMAEKGKTNKKEESEGGDAKADVAENTIEQLNQRIESIKTRLNGASDEDSTALKAELLEVQKQLSDKKSQGDKVANLNKTLKELRQQKEDFFTGKRAPEFLRDSLFEMTETINHGFLRPSFIRYAEYKSGKKFNAIPENLQAKLHEEWKNWGQMERADQVHIAANIFHNVLMQSSPMVQQHAQEYEALLQSEDIKNLQTILNGHLNIFQELKAQTNPENWLNTAFDNLQSLYQGIGLAFSDEDFANSFRELSHQQEDIASLLASDEAILLKQIRDVNADSSLTAEEKEARTAPLHAQIDKNRKEVKSQIEDLHKQKELMMTDLVITSIDSLVNPYIERGFANFEVKDALNKVIQTAVDYMNDYDREYKHKRSELDTEFKKNLKLSEAKQKELDGIKVYLKGRTETINKLKNTQEQLRNLSATPIELLLDLFTVGVNKDIKPSEVIKQANEVLNGVSENIDLFSLSEDMAKQLGEVLKAMDLLESTFEAMKVDDGDMDNLYGYTKTINESSHKSGIQGYVDLAEIKSDTANILKQDLGILRKKALFLLNLYTINSGLKLSEQRRVSLNKDFLFYKRMKAFIDGIGNDDDDWKGKEILKSTIESLETIDKYSLGTTLSLPTEVQAKIEEEVLKMEDAIFDFFKTNEASVKNSKKFAKFLIKNINLYELPSGMLDSKMTLKVNGADVPVSMDDNSFFWWLATRAAVKSTDFHKEYSAIIDGSIAPIPTQELATYQNFASIVNGDCFYRFYQGIRLAIKEDWSEKTIDERKQIIEDLNKNFDDNHKASDDSAADEEYKEYPFTSLIVPKYSHIVFTEGIPGSGKSTGVYKSTIKMILNNPSLRDAHILDRVVFVYGAGSNKPEDLEAARENAKKAISSLGLPNTTSAMSREEFMSTISVDRSLACTQNDDGSWNVPEDRYEMTYEGEYRSKTKLKETDTPFSLVIIDELTNFDLFDLDDINAYARKYGISCLGAGDTDLSGVLGEYIIGKDGTVYAEKENPEGPLKTHFPLLLYSANFPRTPKLGISMRTNNTQKTKNLPEIQIWANLAALDPDAELNLHYYQDETGLYGDKFIGTSMDEITLDDDALATIDLMLSTLKPGEKIGYVTNNEGSELYDYLTQPEFEDKIELLPGTTSQGKEGQYYIIELVKTKKNNYYKDLYTGITRSSQASLIFADEPNVHYIEDKETHDEKLEPSAIQAFASSRKNTLDSLTGEGKPVVYIPRTKSRKKSASSAVAPTPETTTPETTIPSVTPEALVPPVTPEPEPEPEPLPDTTDPAKLVEDAINKASTKGLTVGGLIDFNSTDGKKTFTLTNIRMNDTEVVADLENDTENRTIPFNDLISGNYSSHIEPEPISEYTNSVGLVIKVGDYVLVLAKPEYGKINGDAIYEVMGIENDGVLHCKQGLENVDINSEYIRDTASNYDEAEEKAEENKKYYQTEEVEETEPEVLGLDLKPVEEYKKEIIEINEPLNPVSTVTPEDLVNKIHAFMYSYNTFETGVDLDNNGYPIQFGTNEDRYRIRLDSVNGLMNLDKALEDKKAQAEGRPADYSKVIRKVSEYVNIIGQLRRVIFNTKDKGELDTKISNILNKYFEITGISSRFGFVSHAELTKNGNPTSDGFSTSSGDFMRLQRHTNEDVLFIHSNSERAPLTMRKTISIEIAYNGEDILELPILSLANPLTMLKSHLSDDICFELAIDPKLATNDDLDKIIANSKLIHDKFKGEYDGFIKLCQVYRGVTDDTYYNIGDANWTPCKAFTNKGVQAVGNERGKDYVEPGFEYESDFINLSELAKNPDLTISKIMFSQVSSVEKPDHSLVTIGGKTNIIKIGRPFVLVSTDPNLKGESALVDAWKQDLINESQEPRVKLIYVLPPSIDVPTYIQNLATLIKKGSSNVDYVGNLDTGYRIVKTLFEDGRFFDYVFINKSTTWIPKLQEILNDLEGLEDEDLQDALKETKNIEGIPITNQPVYAIFKRFLAELGYPKAFESLGKNEYGTPKGKIGSPNENNINIISEILAENGLDHINFRANRKINGGTWGAFHEALLTDWTITSVNGDILHYQIHGKIDTNQFEGDITPILDLILKAHAADEKTRKTTRDGSSYTSGEDKMDYIHRHAVSGSVNPGKNRLKSVLERVKKETGLDIDPSTLGTNPLEDIAHLIMEQTRQLAFKIGNKLFISKLKIENLKVYADLDGISEISSLTLDNEGKALFYVYNGMVGEICTAIYDDKTKTIEIFDNPKKGTSEPEVLGDLDYLTISLNLTDEVINKYRLLRPFAKATNSKELTTTLQNTKAKEELLKSTLEKVFVNNPDIIEKILNVIRSKKQSEEAQRSEPKEMCAISSIKIKLY